MGINIEWENPENQREITLTKADGSKTDLAIGDVITYIGREDGVRIVKFTFLDEDNRNNGPIGMTYLPWRKIEKRWATPTFSMKGDPRHIIAYPYGISHFGEHIDWNSVKKIDNPENN